MAGQGTTHPPRPAAVLLARLPTRRTVQLLVGLVLYAASIALLVHAATGSMPWDVLTQGLVRHLALSFGAVTAVIGLLVLLCWIPLRQRPGVGTVANVVVISVLVDPFLALLGRLPAALPLAVTAALAVAGVVLNALATALYIGARMGPGPRDGLMTGLVRRTGALDPAGALVDRGCCRPDGLAPRGHRRPGDGALRPGHRAARARPAAAVHRPGRRGRGRCGADRADQSGYWPRVVCGFGSLSRRIWKARVTPYMIVPRAIGSAPNFAPRRRLSCRDRMNPSMIVAKTIA